MKEVIELEQVVLKYLTASEEQKRDMNKQIKDAWVNLSQKYAALCKGDERYLTIFERIQKIHNAMHFNEYNYYSKTVYIEELDDYNNEFDKKTYNNHKYIYENQNSLISKTKNKLEKLKGSKFAINRENKIKELEAKLEYYDEAINHYRYCLEMMDVQKEYTDNFNTIVKPVEEEYKEILLKHAQTSIKDIINQEPVIVCQKHDTYNGALTSAQGKVLNSLVNDIHDNVMKKIHMQSEKISTKR